MRFTTLLLAAFATIIVTTTSMARKPAVEPVTEIDTSHIKEPPPGQTRGYDFSQEKPKAKTAPTTATKTYKVPTKELKSLEEKSNPAGFVFVLLALLPMAMWLTVIKSYKGPETTSEDLESDYETTATKTDTAASNKRAS